MSQKPSIGRIVHYTLDADDAEKINRRREHAMAHLGEHRENANGVQIHVGNSVSAGDVYPMIIVRVWGGTPDGCVNGQVMLDGNDLYWAMSVKIGDGPRTFAWPPRV